MTLLRPTLLKASEGLRKGHAAKLMKRFKYTKMKGEALVYKKRASEVA